jgi:hypothetical protein
LRQGRITAAQQADGSFSSSIISKASLLSAAAHAVIADLPRCSVLFLSLFRAVSLAVPQYSRIATTVCIQSQNTPFLAAKRRQIAKIKKERKNSGKQRAPSSVSMLTP